ncbi:hypothetical protein [Williamsia soli]|uniref:hypothetical protein n=1 Tax=Williamsia soli TaxID=364929 RepID=UPI001A9DA5AD
MDEPDKTSGVHEWSDMAAWLVESFTDKPVGFILEMGPSGYIDYDDDHEDEVVCAQVQMLADGVMMLRRSRCVLGHLLIADYSSDKLPLNKWLYNDNFDDCTDGYLFSRDPELLADICVTWFRDNWGTESTDALGCEYRFPDDLLPPEDG